MSQIICPIRPGHFSEFLELVNQIDNRADIIEVWLDEISDDFFGKFHAFEKGDMEFLAVCKQGQEKGSFEGSSVERAQVLSDFLSAGGDLVDLDITQNTPEDIERIPPGKLVLSFHDFEGLQKDLDEIFDRMQAFGPAIYKFAVTVNNEEDYDRFMAFVDSFPKEKKAIFTTMGKLGTSGRKAIGKKSWGQFFALDEASKTASGQRTLDDGWHC